MCNTIVWFELASQALSNRHYFSCPVLSVWSVAFDSGLCGASHLPFLCWMSSTFLDLLAALWRLLSSWASCPSKYSPWSCLKVQFKVIITARTHHKRVINQSPDVCWLWHWAHQSRVAESTKAIQRWPYSSFPSPTSCRCFCMAMDIICKICHQKFLTILTILIIFNVCILQHNLQNYSLWWLYCFHLYLMSSFVLFMSCWNCFTFAGLNILSISSNSVKATIH